MTLGERTGKAPASVARELKRYLLILVGGVVVLHATAIGIYYFVRLGLRFRDLRKTEAESIDGEAGSAPESSAPNTVVAPKERA